jgi:hypothetical protein
MSTKNYTRDNAPPGRASSTATDGAELKLCNPDTASNMAVRNPAPDSSPPASPNGTWGTVTVYR